jgi:hypothetical protein
MTNNRKEVALTMKQKQEGLIPSVEILREGLESTGEVKETAGRTEPFFNVSLSAGMEAETAEAQEDRGRITPEERKELKGYLMNFVKTVTERTGSGATYSDEVQVLPAIVEILLTRF